MKYAVVLCAGLLLSPGCFRRPMQVCTDSRITVAGPVTAEVSADMPARQNAEPLTQMVVAGRRADRSCPKIALVDVDGLLVNANLVGPYSMGENPLDLFREKLDAAAADPRIVAVVLRINSPGGGVAATDTMWHELRRFRGRTGLPVVAYLMDVAAGGGYYLATGADEICIHPASVTGGIGVVLNLYNLQDAMAQVNVLSQPIKAGEYIDMGSTTRGMEPEARQWLQAMADQFHERFIEAVVQSRPAVDRADPTTFDGRVFTASQAQQRGLVDRIGYVEDAIRAAQRRAGAEQPGGGLAVRVVMFRRPADPARTAYAVTPNQPPQAKFLPVSIPGLERSKLPMFLYLWNLEPTLERLGGPY